MSAGEWSPPCRSQSPLSGRQLLRAPALARSSGTRLLSAMGPRGEGPAGAGAGQGAPSPGPPGGGRGRRGGSTKVGDCSRRKRPARAAARRPRAGDVRSRGARTGRAGPRGEIPQGCGAGCSGPRPRSPPLPPPAARPAPAAPLLAGKFLESLPGGLCGSNMAELTVEVRGSNGAFYKVPSRRFVGRPGGRGGCGGGPGGAGG